MRNCATIGFICPSVKPKSFALENLTQAQKQLGQKIFCNTGCFLFIAIYTLLNRGVWRLEKKGGL